MKIEITDEHINQVEKILFPNFDFSNNMQVFDKERRDVIKCLETKDIVACAGSGKTTTLIAKLMILDKFFMSFPKNRGICVLTHTNVAIDEIKEKLGESSRLLTYPNFFGTIQSFVNKFLTIPMYQELYKENPKHIDVNWHNSKLFEYYKLNKYSYPELKGLEQEITEKEIKDDFLDNLYLINKEEIKGKHNNYNSVIKKELFCLKEQFLKDEGVLTFGDTYFFANEYLSKYANQLKPLFSSRFSFVFMDEAQDTDKQQQDIVNRIFDIENVIIQKIGDPNQTIFTQNSSEIWSPENQLSITGTKRFHDKISRIAQSVSVENSPIIGNGKDEMNPTIILFDDEQISNVIPKFYELILEKKLYKKNIKKYPIKIVGAVSKYGDKCLHGIISYFSEFEKPEKEKEPYSDTLSGFLRYNSENQSMDYYTKSIIGAICKLLLLVGKSGYNQTKFINEFKEKIEYNHFLLKLIQWSKKMYLKQDIHAELKEYLLNDLANIFCYNITSNTDDFFRIKENDSLKKTSHKYIKNQLEIEIATIHSVKGETHTATLYLETIDIKTGDNDLKLILPYLKKIYIKPQEKLKNVLRMAHVAITRPTDLLCLGIHKKHILDKDKQELEKAGWEIIYL